MQTAPAARPMGGTARPPKGHAGSCQRPAANRAAAPAADGFLSHSFLPRYAPGEALPERAEAEGDYFQSLSRLGRHYGLKLTSYRRLPYPYNVLMATHYTRRAVQIPDRGRELFIIAQEDKPLCVTVRENFKRGYGLYYIPVVPVYRLWQRKRQQATAGLLTAVFAYLHYEAGICFYRDEGSYMGYNYQILEDWIEEGKAEDRAGYQVKMKNLNEAKAAGDFVWSKMRDPALRGGLAAAVQAFQPKTAYQEQVWDFAQRLWELAQAFPGRDLFQHHSPAEDTDEDGYEYPNTIYMHEYVGFIGSTKDALSDDLFQMVDNDFNERSQMQEPQLVTHFDREQAGYTDELAYEQRLFDLLDDLCHLLSQTP